MWQRLRCWWETQGRKGMGFYKVLLHCESGSPREQVPGTELLCSLDGLALS